jgi:hypothetical protein
VRLLALLAALALSACAAAKPDPPPAWQQVFPLHKQKSTTLTYQGVTVVVTPAPPYPDDREVSDEEFRASYEDATVVVTFPGQPPYKVPKDEGRSSPYGISVGIGRMAPGDPAPTVLLAGYSGGMHCCATLQVVSLVDGKPTSVILPRMDGEPVDAFPKDLDRDGERDIAWKDDSLMYAFASHAESWQIPRIYHIRAGKPVDVSRQPGFAKVFRDFADETLKWCRKREPGRNGSCAAYAYAMAVLGKPEDGIRTAVSLAEKSDWVPEDCLVSRDKDDLCPEGKARQFTGFEDALRWSMRQNGYLP